MSELPKVFGNGTLTIVLDPTTKKYRVYLNQTEIKSPTSIFLDTKNDSFNVEVNNEEDFRLLKSILKVMS